MKRNHILLSLPFAFALATTASAEWTLISDFNSEAELDKVTDVTNQVDSGAESRIVDGQWAVFPGNTLEATSNLFAMLDLGVDLKAESLTSGGPVTVYFEVTQPTVDDGAGGTRKAIVDTVWGLANVDPDTVTETAYNSYNAMQRINFGNDAFETRDVVAGSGTYVTIEPLQENVKYKMWMVIDYNLNVYQGYVQGGQWTEQTQIFGGDPSGFIFFRVNPAAEDTVDYFLVALSAGNAASPKGVDPTYLDNVAIDTTGANLTEAVAGAEKGPGYFGNYDVVMEAGEKWVNTGAWMGWVNVENYPYVYILGPDVAAPFDNWAYVADSGAPENKDATGAWMYQFQ